MKIIYYKILKNAKKNALKIQTVVMKIGWFAERVRGEEVYFAPRMVSRVT